MFKNLNFCKNFAAFGLNFSPFLSKFTPLRVNFTRLFAVFFVAFLVLNLSGCADKFDSYARAKNQTMHTQNALQGSEWWRAYKNSALNDLVAKMLENNADLNVARYTFLSAVARYKLINFDMYPNLSANLSASLARDLYRGERSNAFSNALNLSYELDIYGKVRDSKSSAEFSARASLYDLESLKLSLINSTINYAFDLVYFNDVEKLLNEYIANLEESQKIYGLKYRYGRVEELDLLNIEQSLLNAKQNLLSNAQNRELIIKNLQDLLGKKANFSVLEKLQKLSLSDFKELGVDFNVSTDIFANRPDVKSKASSLNSAFKDYKSMQKSMYPSISLGGSLSGSDKNFADSFKLLNLGGTLQISLPFLDYGRVRQNIQVSRFEYESRKISYEQALQAAINEFYACFKDYEFNTKLYENIKIINAKQEQITQAYLQKYEFGRAEMKDYLDAKNSFINSSQEILRSRLNLLKTINSYYQITTISQDEDE